MAVERLEHILMLTIFANSKHKAGPASDKREVSGTMTAVLYPHLTSRQLVHLGPREENASISPGNAKQGVIHVLRVSVSHFSRFFCGQERLYYIHVSFGPSRHLSTILSPIVPL